MRTTLFGGLIDRVLAPAVGAMLASGLFCAGAASGQQSLARTLVHEDADGRRTMLLDPRGYPLYESLGHEPALQPAIEIVPQGELGYDIVYRFHNTSRRAAKLGRIGVGIITLGEEMSFLDHARDGAVRSVDRPDFRAQVRNYPDQLYSPLAVLMNDGYAVGVSLLYDVLSDRHDARVGVLAPNGRYATGPGGAGYAVRFELGDPAEAAEDRVAYDATLAPGQRRTYTVAVRAMVLDRPRTPGVAQEWLEVVRPYRDHFEGLYGGVAYSRDPRPTRAFPLANSGHASERNPLAYWGGDHGRPDKVGFAPFINWISANTQNYPTTLLIAPSGLQQNVSLNFPSRFMSPLQHTSELQTAFDPARGFPSLAGRGVGFGFWWGRAAQVSPGWNMGPLEELDLRYPGRVSRAWHEFQLATLAGADLIGLDAFTHARMPVWQQYEWILRMRRHNPELKVIIEPSSSDVMHTVAGTFYLGWEIVPGTSHDRFYKLREPLYLADYLVPGHETWARFSPGRIAGERGAIVTAQQAQLDAEHFAGLGLVPNMQADFDLLSQARATAEASWTWTVPERLKTDAHRASAPPALELPPAEAGAAPDAPPPGTLKDNRPFTLPNGRVIWLPVYE